MGRAAASAWLESGVHRRATREEAGLGLTPIDETRDWELKAAAMAYVDAPPSSPSSLFLFSHPCLSPILGSSCERVMPARNAYIPFRRGPESGPLFPSGCSRVLYDKAKGNGYRNPPFSLSFRVSRGPEPSTARTPGRGTHHVVTIRYPWRRWSLRLRGRSSRIAVVGGDRGHKWKKGSRKRIQDFPVGTPTLSVIYLGPWQGKLVPVPRTREA
ncbi:hypothetical protein GGR56DRAFT_606405 [Xylariaceae sp. FL0804]|nr:hypothetical protein GGR56DRAFT_606405 [Xylariaceae sp. FL0804]